MDLRRLPTLTLLVVSLLCGFALGSGCSALRTLAALDSVELSLDGVSGGRLAGVDLRRYRTLAEVPPGDLLRIGGAYRQGRLPLAFIAHVGAENPGANEVDARLERLGWTLRLNGRDTVSGVVDRPVVLPAGDRVDIPVAVELDLLEFFSDNRDDLIGLALALAGRGGDPQRLELAVRPTVTTPIGPIAYPGEIVLRGGVS
jgi:hypothetical protein